MFLLLLVTLAIAGMTASAPNIRSVAAVVAEAEQSDVVDHKRAQFAFEYLRSTSHAHHEKHESLVTSLVGAGDSHAMQIMDVFADGFNGHHVTRTVAGAENHTYVHDAFLITRLFPNGDGSGKAIHLAAVKTGCRFTYGYSNSYRCGHETPDGRIPLSTSYFSNGNCSGEPYYRYDDYYTDKLSIAWSSNYIPLIQKLQCGTPTREKILSQPGLVSIWHEEGRCDGHIEKYNVEKFGGCEMVMEGYRSFYFARFDTCSPSAGTLSVSGYSDPGCTRPLFRGDVHIASAYPGFGGCSGGNSTICVPPM